MEDSSRINRRKFDPAKDTTISGLFRYLCEPGRGVVNIERMLEAYNPELLSDIHDSWAYTVRPANFTEVVYCFYYHDNPVCPYRQKKRRFYTWSVGYRCSRKCKCTLKSMIDNNRSKWDADFPMQTAKCKNIFADKYRKKTGYDNPFQNPEVQKKAQKTSSMSFIKERSAKKRKETVRNKNPERYDYCRIRNLLETHSRSEVARIIGSSVSYIDKVIKEQNWTDLQGKDSYYEIAIRGIFDDIGIEYIEGSFRIIKPKQLDFYIPGKKTAVEFNGTRWHGEKVNNCGPEYHIGKTKRCNELGIHLLHIFQDQWDKHPEAARSLIKRSVGAVDTISADDTVTKVISSRVCQDFVSTSSVFDYVIADYHFSLCYNNEVYAVCSVKDKAIVNFALKNNVDVAGASRRLFLFAKDCIKTDLFYYADRTVYKQDQFSDCFENIGVVPPGFLYSKGAARISKELASEFLKDKPSTLSNHEYMINRGFDRIWDCGYTIWRV